MVAAGNTYSHVSHRQLYWETTNPHVYGILPPHSCDSFGKLFHCHTHNIDNIDFNHSITAIFFATVPFDSFDSIHRGHFSSFSLCSIAWKSLGNSFRAADVFFFTRGFRHRTLQFQWFCGSRLPQPHLVNGKKIRYRKLLKYHSIFPQKYAFHFSNHSSLIYFFSLCFCVSPLLSQHL